MTLAVERRFDIDASEPQLLVDAYDDGRLNELLPDGCFWMVLIGDDGRFTSIEPMRVDTTIPILRFVMVREGSFVMRTTNESEQYLRALSAPSAELMKRLKGN
ncbi:hypothetical protein [Rhodopirellula bahusiensis]|uniref:Uncharacterized protein n=1 Tax=Rhodopirellula bahusiensis TaxID=2014065 RepID=A0A2G1W832_9BACT|nr:hypothetical protein [Rhodopirellula bahusiensis]PHQ35171.1 hypothetical protein CEE69_12230 [Rhodopirellula bahusiensis]